MHIGAVGHAAAAPGVLRQCRIGGIFTADRRLNTSAIISGMGLRTGAALGGMVGHGLEHGTRHRQSRRRRRPTEGGRREFSHARWAGRADEMPPVLSAMTSLSDPAGAIGTDRTSSGRRRHEARSVDCTPLPVVRRHTSSRERCVLLQRCACRHAGAMGIARSDDADCSVPDSAKTRHPIPRYRAALGGLPGIVSLPLPMRFVSPH